MNNMNRHILIASCVCLVLVISMRAHAACPPGTLWEPYTEVCADVRDVRAEFLPAMQFSISAHDDAPIPGSMSAGIAYAPDQLVALSSGRLHTRMFVYPDGLERDSALPAWLYTTATTRVDDGLEVAAMYAEHSDVGYLGLFAWSCLPDYPCPNGATAPNWQWSRPMPELTCNITQVVDQGGHAQKQLYYANHSDRLDDGSPPMWRSAVYVWNYCDAAWDLAWEHSYRQNKVNCSVPGAGCAWWGPSVEIFGDTMYPQIGEVGYEDSLLYHDGVWSRLLPPEAQFRDPADPRWGSLTPWQLFHLEPNRSYGVGSWFNENDTPVIEDQDELSIDAGESLPIETSQLTINDADVDPAYHVDFKLTVYGGDNYTYSNGTLTPDDGFTGTLIVPISVSDGFAESDTFDLLVTVGPEDRVLVIEGQVSLQTREDQSIDIGVDDLVIDYSGDDPADLMVIVHSGQFYTFSGTTVTPQRDFAGEISVPVTVSDGVMESDAYELEIAVTAVNDPPTITGQHAVETFERTPVELHLSDLEVADPDNDFSELLLGVLDGAGYQRNGNTVIPEPGVTGILSVRVVVNDGDLDSDIYLLSVQVLADNVPPQIVLNGSASVTIRQGATYTDAGATATDNVDGDISGRIVVNNGVDTSRAGTYSVTYSVTDFAGNSATAARSVVVQAAEPVQSSGGGGAISILFLVMLILPSAIHAAIDSSA